MSDNIDEALETQVEPEEQEIEIAVGEPEPEKKPEVVTLSPAEFATLKAQGDSAQAIQKGIEGLSNRFAAPQVAPPANAPMQTPEEFYADHADDMFDKEKAPKIMRQYNKMVMEAEYGPMFNAQAQALVATKKELLVSKEPLFKKYESEVEQLVKSQPGNVQLQPDVYDRAWLTIRERHRSEIEEESVNDKVAKAVEAKLGNERFMQNAKPEIIDNELKKKADALAKIKIIDDSLAELAG